MDAIIKKAYIIIFKDGSIRLTDELTSDDFMQVRKNNINIIDVQRKRITRGIDTTDHNIHWKIVKVKDAIESKPLSDKNLD